MSQKQYDLIIYIGRFQPFHNGHKKTIDIAEELADEVLVLVGSANAARSPKNPWTYEERRRMIQEMPFDTYGNVSIRPINDYIYNDTMWTKEVGKAVADYIDEYDWNTDDMKIAVIGHDKDHSSYYLNNFPQFGKYIPVPAFPEHGETIDATKIRRLLFSKDYHFIKGVVPIKVYEMIEKFSHTKEYEYLKSEWDYVEEYKESWKAAPYAPTFVTVDSVVVQSGHVLLVQRGEALGYDLWALPGGFIDPHEKLRDASIRELLEETQLKVPEKILNKAISDKDTEVFDAPDRSSRGRTITHCFLYKLEDDKKLPHVRGADDAKKARWFSFAELDNMSEVMFEDHWHMAVHMINKLENER